MGSTTADDDLLLKNFFAEVSEVERDNEVLRFCLSLSLSMQNYDFVFVIWFWYFG
jgi:DnaJ family protein C protein 8